MSFLNMDDFLSEAHDSTIAPHPLTENSIFTIDAKVSYLALVLFSLLVDRGELDAETEQYVHDLGVSLWISDSEIQTLRSSISSLSTSQARINFIKENVSAVQERDLAMFLYCEMSKAANRGGTVTQEVASFLDGMIKLLKISAKDAVFLQAYRNYFADGKIEEIFPFILGNQDCGITLPAEFVRYFTPQAIPVPLNEGPLPDGETHIENGIYRLTGVLEVHARSIVIAQNATIILTNQAYIDIGEGNPTIKNCKFIAEDDGSAIKKDYMIQTYGSGILEISHCEFHGQSRRSGIYVSNRKLIVKNCIFTKLYGQDHGILNYGGALLECYGSSFLSCRVCGSPLLSSAAWVNSNVKKLMKCIFKDCSASSLTQTSIGGEYAYYLLKIERCIFPIANADSGFNAVGKSQYISVIDSVWGGSRDDPKTVQEMWDK